LIKTLSRDKNYIIYCVHNPSKYIVAKMHTGAGVNMANFKTLDNKNTIKP
jgi:hypothetical protein